MNKKKSRNGSYKQVNMMVSLPTQDGIKIKGALKEIADENSRSVSNLVTLVLREYLVREGRL
jgi:hypothetical protein